MDHRYIDDSSVADRYLDHALSPEERLEFEAHLVDCQECTDRVLLAEMFHNRNGRPKPVADLAKPVEPARVEPSPVEPLPIEPPKFPAVEPQVLRVRFAGRLSRGQILLMATGAAIVVLVPTLLLIWVMRR